MVEYGRVVVMWRTVLVVTTAIICVVVAEVDLSSELSHVTSHHRPRQQCSGFCKVSRKFELQKRRTYVYQYEGVVSTGVEGVSQDTSQINVTAEVHLRVEDNPCDLVLLVRNAHLYDSGSLGLEESPRQSEWATGLEQWPLRLSYQDGRVDQLCPAAEEPSWALDFKRGLLSALQNSMPDLFSNTHLHERDVSGTCDTTYTVSPSMFDYVEILRRKDLHSCSGRDTLRLSGVLPSSTPIVRSEQICKQQVSDTHGRHISRVHCYETHIFSPFSNGQAGLRTQANMTLTLAKTVENEEDLNIGLFINHRTSLKGEFKVMDPEVSVSENDAELTLKQLNSQSQQGLGEEVPKLFDQLVHQMAKLGDKQLFKLFASIQENKARKSFLDALPLVGTSGSVKAMYQIYKAEEVSRDELESWLSALAFHPKPTQEMLNTLNLIMQDDGYHPKTWLAVGAIINAYCRNDASCQETQEVMSILARLALNLGQSCYTSDKEMQESVVATLKAFGNAGVFPSINTLNQCFLNDNNVLEVRLAALSATRRLPCNMQDKMPFLENIFLRRNLDSELRIAAYLAAMQCPSASTLSIIKDSLYSDDVNQVLSFVWTHLTNIQESSSSWKKEIRKMLQDSYLENKFRTDARKFSRNYELSVQSEVMKMGATVESNVVFSHKSYLPRSANLNLTVDLFGKVLNLFEVGTRLEGFESMVEDIFGPAGYFPDESIQTMIKNMKPSDNEKNEVIQSMGQKFSKNIEGIPQGLFFARIFGNELYLTQFSSIDKLINLKSPRRYTGKFFADALKSIFDHKQIDYTKSFKLVNTQYMIPTVLGFPLKFEVNGTAAISFEMKTDLDLHQILKTQTGNIALFLNPSAVLELDGKMMVDATFAQSGVETKAKLKTNTYLDFKVSLDKGKVLDVIVNVPRKQADVIDVKSMVYLRQRDQVVELEGIGELTQWDTCSGLYVPTITGLRGCSQLVLRNASNISSAPYFPLTGRFHYTLAIQKPDNFNVYHLHVEKQYELSKLSNKGKILISMDTPGSQLNRLLSAELLFSNEGPSIDGSLELKSPWANLDVAGKLFMTEAEMSLDFKTQVGNTQVAATHFGVRRDINYSTVRFEPYLVVQSEHWGINFNMSGYLDVAAGQHYKAGLVVHNPTEVLWFGGEVTRDSGHYTSDITLRAAGMDITINGKLVNTPSLLSCKAKTEYRVGTDVSQTIEFFSKLQTNWKHKLLKRHLIFNLQMREWPLYNTRVSWILHHGHQHFDSRANVTLGQIQWRQQLTYINNLYDRDKGLELTLGLVSPMKQVDYKAEILFKTGVDFIHCHILAQLNKNTQFISLLDYRQESSLNKLELELATPWHQVTLETKLETLVYVHSGENQINGTAILKWGDILAPQWISAGGKYLVAESTLLAQHRLEGWLEGQQWSSPLRLEANWLAEAKGDLIQSLWHMNASYDTNTYMASAFYVKESSLGKHDFKLDLILPGNSYSSNVIVINNLELKNVTVRLDLEKTQYFTTQFQSDEQFQMQMFWDYLEDQSQNVLIQYKTSKSTELAIFSMPGHFASLTIDKLGQGLLPKNITAVWGKSEDSAMSKIVLSTYWMFDMNSYHKTTLPTVHTNIELSTPFVGFEHQSFEFKLSSDDNYYTPKTVLYVSTRWQDQFLDLNFYQEIETVYVEDNYNESAASIKFYGEVSSSLMLIGTVKMQVRLVTGNSDASKIYIEAVYNKHTELAFMSVVSSSKLNVSMLFTDTSKNRNIFSCNLSVADHSVELKVTLPENKQVLFDMEFNWPNRIGVNLVTPIFGHEVVSAQYHAIFDGKNVESGIYSRTGKHFVSFLMKFDVSDIGFSGELNMTSSLPVPDVSVTLEHKLSLSDDDIFLKDVVTIIVITDGKTDEFGHALITFSGGKSSSTKWKEFQSILQLPGHYSSSNYSYKTVVTLTGIEVKHCLTHLWNSEKTEVHVLNQDLTFISAFLKQNDEKKAELYFKKSPNNNYRTDVTLLGNYVLQHRLLITSWTNWDNFFSVTTPRQKLVIKSLQTLNYEKTNYVHKSMFSMDKEISFIDLSVNLDEVTRRVKSVLLSTTTPWNDPMTAKYDLDFSTKPKTMYTIGLKYGKNKEVIAELDISSADPEHSVSLNILSPFCKQLGGSVKIVSQGDSLSVYGAVMTYDRQFVADMNLIKNLKAPKLEFSFNDTNKNIIHLSCNYDVTNNKNIASLKASYLKQHIYLNGHYYIDKNKFQTGISMKTPFESWKETSCDLEFLLSDKNSTLLINLKKENKFIVLSAFLEFQSNLIKSSISIEYLKSSDTHRHTAILELSSDKESAYIGFQMNNNEINSIDLSINGFINSDNFSDQKSYILNYKAILPIECFHNISGDIKYMCNEIKCYISGNTNIENWQASFKGEIAFIKSSVGYLDFNACIKEDTIKTHVQYKASVEEDEYSWHLSNNDHFINGSMLISNITNRLKVKYIIESSVYEFRNVSGNVLMEFTPTNLTTMTLTTINEVDDYIFHYSAMFDKCTPSVYHYYMWLSEPMCAEHSLKISVPIPGLESIIGHFKYGLSDKVIEKVEGNLTIGTTVNSLLFYHNLDKRSNWNINIHLPDLIILNGQSNIGIKEGFVQIWPNDHNVCTLLNFTLDKTGVNLSIAKNLSEFLVTVKPIENKVIVVGAYNNHTVSAIIEKNHVNDIILEFTSNIPNWTEMTIRLSEREKFTISATKEKHTFLYYEDELKYRKGSILLKMPTLFIELNVAYDLINLSMTLKFNINSKANFKDIVNLMPESIQISFEPPVRDIENMTLISNVKRNDNKDGVSLFNNRTYYDIDISMSLKNKMIDLQATVTVDNEEFNLSIGAQNSTELEPKSTSIYISAFRNTRPVFLASLECLYNIDKKTGIKLFTSSSYYNQTHFELFSLKKQLQHNIVFNYNSGNDVDYLLNSTIIRELSNLRLIIESRFRNLKNDIEISYNIFENIKRVVLLFNHNDYKFMNIQAEMTNELLASDIKITIENKNILANVKCVNILSTYNFKNGSLMNASLTLDSIKYFEIFMKSHSLFSLDFRSSLSSLAYLNYTYNISLIYQLGLPLTAVYSFVDLDGDYYDCSASFNWDNQLAITLFQLKTNAGYGFENAALSAKYKLGEVNSYMMNFIIDKAILFHIACDISYPSMMSIELDLPDTLFLPNARRIRGKYQFTEDEKKIGIHYKSELNEKRELDILVLFKNQHYIINVDMSENNDNNLVQSYNSGGFLIHLFEGNIDFKTNVVWRGNTLFSFVYFKEVLKDINKITRTLPNLLFGLENSYSWNITASPLLMFEFYGTLNSSDISFFAKYPSTVYLNKFGVREVKWTKSIGVEEFFLAHYKNEQITELAVEYTDVLEKIEHFVQSNIKFVSTDNLTVNVNDRVVAVYKETACEMYSQFTECMKIKQVIEVTGLGDGPNKLYYEIDLSTYAFSWSLTTTNHNITFVGNANLNSKVVVSILFSSSSMPDQPFSLKYDSDHKKTLYVSLNLFETCTREISFNIEKKNGISKINAYSKNTPYLKDFSITLEFSSTSVNVKGHLDKDNFKLLLVSSNYIHILVLESSYKALKIFKITHETTSSNNYHSGIFKFEGSECYSEWEYFISQARDGTVFFRVKSDKDVQFTVVVELNKTKEISIQLKKDGHMYEGKGSILNIDQGISAEGFLAINEKLIKLSIQCLVTMSEHKATLKIITPTDYYFIEGQINKNTDDKTPFATLKYKTPVYPFQHGDLSILYCTTHVNNKEYLLIEEKNMKNKPSYNTTVIGITLNTETIHLDNLNLTILYGEKTGLIFHYFSKKFELLLFHVIRTENCALRTIFHFQGFKIPSLNFLVGKSSVRAFLDRSSNSFLVSIETPAVDNIILTSEHTIKRNIVDLEGNLFYNNEYNISSKLVVGQKTYLTFNSESDNLGKYKGSFDADSVFQQSLNLKYTIQNDNVRIDMKFMVDNNTVIDSEVLYLDESAAVEKLSKSVQVFIKKFMSVPEKNLINPKVFINWELNNDSLVIYSLHFTNGMKSNLLSFSGNGSLSLTDPQSFSLTSKPHINAHLILDTLSSKYTVVTNISLQRTKIDAIMTMSGQEKLSNDEQNLEFISISLKFGALLEDSYIELYLNENKILLTLENLENETKIIANISLEKLEDSVISFVTTITYSPVFQLSIYHTIFPTPCKVLIKVDLKDQSIESALNILYNDLEQQAFVNIYLGSNSKSAEIIYIDIWKQTHDVSVHIDESDDEVSLKGNINSPALDEKFLVSTVGKSGNKLELNINDDFILRAFKDNNTMRFDLHFQNDFKIYFKSEEVIELHISVSPLISGMVSFKLAEDPLESFTKVFLYSNGYNLKLEINTDKPANISLKYYEENILHFAINITHNGTFELAVFCDVFEYENGLLINQSVDPISLLFSLNSSYVTNSNLLLNLGFMNEDDNRVTKAVFQLKREGTILITTTSIFDKESKAFDVTFAAPIFSKMDEAKLSGTFNIGRGDFEVNLTSVLMSSNLLISRVNVYLAKHEDIFSSELFINNQLKSNENIVLSLTIPLSFAFDMKARLFIQMPSQKSYEMGFTMCLSRDIAMVSAIGRWPDFIVFLELKTEETPFYAYLYEMNLHYMGTKFQIGAWTNPKYPITDFIYFLDVDDRRIAEVSYSLIIRDNHYKSKLIVHTVFKGHEKYGIDCEFKSTKNLNFGKIVKILASAPKFGTDLGIHFEFSFDSWKNYTLLAQFRIPHRNQIKMARLYSLQQISPNLNLKKINHSIYCTGLGKFGWELTIYGPIPYILQAESTSLETKVFVNNNIYSLNTKSNLQAENIELALEIETPFDQLNQGSVSFYSMKEIAGSELIIYLNSENTFRFSMTEDKTNTIEFHIYSKWKSVAGKYRYEVDTTKAVKGYICWDLGNKETSQFGISVNADSNNNKYLTDFEIILPSKLIPEMTVKSTYEVSNQNRFSIKLEYPGLSLTGKFAKDSSTNSQKIKSELAWSFDGQSSKHVSLLMAKELSVEGSKHYFILQHFALKHDLMVAVYNKETVYAINVQYSPSKVDEITMEFGYSLENGKCGLKLVTLHPATNTLFFVIANKTDTSNHIEGGISVSYISDNEPGVVKYVEIYGKKTKNNPQLLVSIASNGNNLAVRGSVWKKDDTFQGVKLETLVNQNEPIKLEIEQNVVNPGIEMVLSHGPSRSYRISAGMPSTKEITAQLSHTSYGRPIVDALASIRLNTSKVIWGKFQILPLTQVGLELYKSIVTEYSGTNHVFKAITRGFYDLAQEDFSKKVALLLNDISSATDILIFQSYNEIAVIKNKFGDIVNAATKAYNDDHLYLKTINLLLKQFGRLLYDHLTELIQILVGVSDCVLAPARSIVLRVWQVIESVTSQWILIASQVCVKNVTPLRDMSQLVAQYQSLRANIFRYIGLALYDLQSQFEVCQKQWIEWMVQAEVNVNKLIGVVEKTMSWQIHRLCNYKETVLAGFSVLRDTITDMMEIVISGVYSVKEIRYAIKSLAEFVGEVNTWLEHFQLELYLQHINAFFDRVVLLMSEDFKKSFGEYEEYLVKLLLVLEDQLLNSFPVVNDLYATATDIYLKAKWLWGYANLNKKLKGVMQELIDNFIAMLKEWNAILDKEEGNPKYEYDYNPENNILTFTQELPFEWRAFDELPYNLEYNAHSNQSPLMFRTQEYIDRIYKVLQPIWHDYKLISPLLPSFSVTALFTLNNIVTFDNSFYSLTGNCRSYLLVGDLQHNSFSLVADYHSQEQRDLILIVKDVSVTLKDNLKVYINDSLVELPKQLPEHQISIERKVNSVLIESKRGFSLECSIFLKLCKFQLSGWYVGKAAGLLVTYNNEYHDENHMLYSKEKEYIESWALGKNLCEDKGESSVIPDSYMKNEIKCKDLFLSQYSPLAPCFYIEDPEIFNQMCNSQSSADNVCSSVYAYVTKCLDAGVELELPSTASNSYLDCGKFTVFNTLINITNPDEESDTKMVRAELSADVVFVVESAASCFTDSRLVSRLATSLAIDLDDQNFTQNNFALISYSGKGVQIHTFNGELWTHNQEQLADLLGSLDDVDSSEESQYLLAMRAVDLLAFRPYASRVVILVHCSGCPPLSDNIPPLLQNLQLNDAVVHVVQRDSLVNHLGEPISKTIGFERSGAYRQSDQNNTPNPQISKKISVLQDMCSQLALGTNGTVFSLDELSSLRLWSSRVTSGALPNTPWRLCDYVIGGDNVPVWRCVSFTLHMENHSQLSEEHDYMNMFQGDNIEYE